MEILLGVLASCTFAVWLYAHYRDDDVARLATLVLLVMTAVVATAWLPMAFADEPPKQKPTLVLAGTSEESSFVLRLFDRPCIDADVIVHVLGSPLSPLLIAFKASRLTWRGDDYASCWIVFEEKVYSVDTGGDWLNGRDGLPFKRFAPEAI